jgi:hypothetical protein
MTTTRCQISLPVAANTARRYDEAMTYLANGWIELTYRKANGETVTRLATRNPTLIDTFGDRWSRDPLLPCRRGYRHDDSGRMPGNQPLTPHTKPKPGTIRT